jgi:hypothetical protein
VISVDAADSSVTIKDLATKQPVMVRITGDSQMRKLNPVIAQAMAARVKGGSRDSEGRGRAPAVGTSPAAVMAARANGGHGEFDQMLSRIPAMRLTELQKGDAVMIVATRGNGAQVTAITLLSGVEPILTSSPNGADMVLSPWDLGGGSSEMGNAQ